MSLKPKPSELTLGMLGAGEMGAALAARFGAAGYETLGLLKGRSSESLARAREAGLRDAGGAARLAAACDIIFSVLPPSEAESAARRLADGMGDGGKRVWFVEANAISPDLSKRIAGFFRDMNAEYVDGGLVGSPPGSANRPRLYVSGRCTTRLQALDGIAFDLVELGFEIGKASGLKMAYASLTKGINALLTAGLLAAEEMDLLAPFVNELGGSQAELLRRAEANIPRLPADSARWVREMEEIRDTFVSCDLPGGFHQASAEIMDMLSKSPFGTETRRTRDQSRSMLDTVAAVSRSRKRQETGD
ncbi:MAG: DUF1932 domain-containing protein [Albidovulum sp.]|nr:DUF1932 domain-containing protein [Albidovulum sp.]MDE0303991.1 DUF1932 domain-containing protein [Albidovulum sp.]MDE0532498.1 DUF1932 domain-containing protein [Albidovulum sp.]